MMNCPKCSVEQSDERTDCVNCGIVFERWEALQERARLAPQASQITIDDGTQTTIPPPLIILGLIVVLTLGAAWTVHSKRARAENAVAMDDLLNEINQKGLEVKQRLAHDDALMQQGEPPLNPAWRQQWDWAVSPSTLPDMSGLAGKVNRIRAAKPYTVKITVGDVSSGSPGSWLRELEQLGDVTLTKDKYGNFRSSFTTAGLMRARANWRLESDRDGVTVWRVPVAKSEIIELVKEESDGVSRRILTKFRWVPTDEGSRLGFKIAGPFREIVDVMERSGGTQLTTIESSCKWPARS